MEKTNVMRILDSEKIPYSPMEYTYNEDDLSGFTIAKEIGINPDMVFKTLVLKGDKTGILVICLPVSCEVNLKKAASISGNKKVEMLHVSELLKNVGYIRGACSPIGMKKKFPTFIDESILLFDKITISAGIRGCQLLLTSKYLLDFLNANICDIADQI